MVKPTVVDDNTFAQIVLEAKMPVLVDFWAPWCAPCLMVAPIVEELAEEYNGRISFVKLNVDNSQKVVTRYGIRSIPTLLLFNDGKPVQQVVGFRPKSQLKQELDALLS